VLLCIRDPAHIMSLGSRLQVGIRLQPGSCRLERLWQTVSFQREEDLRQTCLLLHMFPMLLLCSSTSCLIL
jgi:hypothetical protein